MASEVRSQAISVRSWAITVRSTANSCCDPGGVSLTIPLVVTRLSLLGNPPLVGSRQVASLVPSGQRALLPALRVGFAIGSGRHVRPAFEGTRKVGHVRVA